MDKKKILITGKGSYVGTNFIKWLKQWPDQYDITEISVRGNGWKNVDFSQYDTVLHVAGIAHVSADPKMEEKYYKVNRDLTIEVALHAKEQGVKQFVFMSSIIIYGETKKNINLINKNTTPNPANFYGASKLQAEEGINELEDDIFKISIIRPPMIYGKNSKGNFNKLILLSKKTLFVPTISNQRSMIFIFNLTEFLKIVIDNQLNGVFFPQNKEYTNTSTLIYSIAKAHNRKLVKTKVFNLVIINLVQKSKLFNKLFGNLTYDQNISSHELNYANFNLEESIKLSI
jgi:nucleoside-diphosphate-sugar epimerase